MQTESMKGDNARTVFLWAQLESTFFLFFWENNFEKEKNNYRLADYNLKAKQRAGFEWY